MAIHRILVLGVTFFLVALFPRFDMALVVLALGVFVYSALWVYEVFNRKDKQ